MYIFKGIASVLVIVLKSKVQKVFWSDQLIKQDIFVTFNSRLLEICFIYILIFIYFILQFILQWIFSKELIIKLQLSYVFDNTSTVIFAAMMSIFATLFLEGWKRYHAEVAWKWGLLDFEVDEVLCIFFLKIIVML